MTGALILADDPFDRSGALFKTLRIRLAAAPRRWIMDALPHKRPDARILGMGSVHDLRKQASLCRKAAGAPTEGGHRTNRMLIWMAEQLERQAEELEREAPSPKPSSDQ